MFQRLDRHTPLPVWYYYYMRNTKICQGNKKFGLPSRNVRSRKIGMKIAIKQKQRTYQGGIVYGQETIRLGDLHGLRPAPVLHGRAGTDGIFRVSALSDPHRRPDQYPGIHCGAVSESVWSGGNAGGDTADSEVRGEEDCHLRHSDLRCFLFGVRFFPQLLRILRGRGAFGMRAGAGLRAWR